jgi:transposase-like protein
MKTVVEVRKGRKPKDVCRDRMAGVRMDMDPRRQRIEMIQALIPLGLEAVRKELDRELEELTGPRYARHGGQKGLARWGGQSGSVYLLDQKVPVRVPRVRDLHRDAEVPLETYAMLQSPHAADRALFGRILGGLSCRDYGSSSRLAPESFGLSASTVSRRFIEASASRLREIQERRLEGLEIVAVFLDGKAFAEEEIVLAVGITIAGEKKLLGFIQTATENEGACRQFLQGLVDRGLSAESGLLFVIDGGKGLRKAISSVFGKRTPVQRCQWHKRENVISHLSRSRQARVRKRLKVAQELPDYEKAKAALMKIHAELKETNESAAASLLEGLEETLTLQRLGLARELGRSFKTTNVIESVQSMIGRRTDKVDHWRNSNQLHRWFASTLLETEPRLRKVVRIQASAQTPPGARNDRAGHGGLNKDGSP